MSANTLIEWAHHTVNFWWGCTFARLLDGSIRQECINCYAKAMAAIFSRGRATWGEDGNRMLRLEKAADELLALDRRAKARGVRERVFINSMSDTFEDRIDLAVARQTLFLACEAVSNLDCLLLTKRPQNVTRMVPAAWLQAWPAHVWVGTTAGTQQAADEGVEALLRVPARIRFLSCEPLLERVNITGAVYASGRLAESEGWGVHWVIVGGESGPRARPMNPEWVTYLKEQCTAHGVPFFFKQWGEWAPAVESGESVSISCVAPGCPKDPAWHRFDDGALVGRAGKKPAGRILDGREWNQVPEVFVDEGEPGPGI